MTYSKNLVSVDIVDGSALIGFIVIGSTRIGQQADQHTGTADLAAVTISTGYTLNAAGALEIEPSTASATYAFTTTDPPATAPAIAVGTRLEISYNGVIVFQGVVMKATQTSKALGYGKYEKRLTLQLSSKEVLFLGSPVSWDASGLPEEPADTRLARFVTVDESLLAAGHAYAAAQPVAAVSGSGTSTILDQARAFTEATGLPLRVADGSWGTLSLVIDDAAVAWSDSPLVASSALPAAGTDAWITTHTQEASWLDNPVPIPTEASVVNDDTRLLGGLVANAWTGDTLGSFIIGTSRIGTSGTAYSGFRPGMAADIYGETYLVSHITHTLADTYSAGIEISAPMYFVSGSAAALSAANPDALLVAAPSGATWSTHRGSR